MKKIVVLLSLGLALVAFGCSGNGGDGNGGDGGTGGTGGTGGSTLCTGVDCTSDNQCVEDGTCDPTDGSCVAGDPKPQDTSCTEDGGTLCDGAGKCVQCNTAGQCDDLQECTTDACESDGSCTNTPVADDTACAGDAGTCKAGVCDLCAGKVCEDLGDCLDNTCNSLTGQCESSLANEGGSCDGGAGTCENGACCKDGVCCTVAADCPDDGNECTTDPSCTNNACEAQVNKGDGTACADGAGTCQSGVCQVPPTFALGGEFRAYNSLLAPANPTTECTQPNLSLVPGANLTGILSQCVKATPPDVSGNLTLTNTGANNWDVDGVLDLDFVIAASIESVNAEVNIVTSSSTPLNGTGTGTVSDGGTITMDALNPFYNVRTGTKCLCDEIAGVPQACGPAEGGECPVDGQLCAKPRAGEFFPGACATGTVFCEAFNNLGVGTACTTPADCPQTDPTAMPPVTQTCTGGTCDPVDVSVAVCPLANLDGGINLTPLPADPLQRAWPTTLTFSGAGKLNMQMDGGPSVPAGWYLNNPTPMAGNGTQFVTLTGVEQ
jgi:hypothetical protein